MDLENKPNMRRTRIGGGYMVVVYGSGGGIWQRWWYMDTDWWWYMDTDWWWYMDTDSERWRISNGGRWQGDDDGAAAA